MGKNPWNTTMSIDFDGHHKNVLVEFYWNKRRKKDVDIPKDSKSYLLKKYYDEEYGLKALARALDLTYTRIRTLFRYLEIEHRKGYDIVTDRVKKFRSERVKGDKNPWRDWNERLPDMHKNGG